MAICVVLKLKTIDLKLKTPESMLSWWTELDTWIVIAGALCALSCALLGNYLVLRRMSMMGDAISHAVLPGLAIAFLITGSRDNISMFIGAVIIGVITALLIQVVSHYGNVDEGAAMGVIFTALFAAGLILIRQAADKVDLDPGCVLYGAVEYSPLDTISIFSREIPKAVVLNGSILILNTVFVLLFYKELKVSSFDPALATTLGINANVIHYILMCLVAATTVAAFQTVGSILVIAMLIVPAAAAYLLTDRLSLMIVFSLIIAGASAFFGHVSAIVVPQWFGLSETSTAGMMATMSGFIFFIVLILAPRHGLLSRLLHRLLLGIRITADDVLALLYRATEAYESATAANTSPPVDIPVARSSISHTLRSPVMANLAMLQLRWRGLLDRSADGYALTLKGLHHARAIIRSHRLWEGYLVEELGLKSDHVHTTAEVLEHITDLSMREALAEATGLPDHDPHQRPIPPEENGD